MLINLNDCQPISLELGGEFKGIVKDNKDPLKIGRVKCIIEDVYPKDDIDALPWTMSINETFLGGSKNSEWMCVPEIDSELIIVFPFKNIYFPFYRGYWKSEKTKTGEFDTDYPDVYGWKDSKGNIFKVNKKTGLVEFIHFSSTKIIIKPNGDVEIGNSVGANNYVVQADWLKAYIDAKIKAVYNNHKHSYIPGSGAPTDTGTPNNSIDSPNIAVGEINSLKHRIGD